eukprot:1383569-Prymnesium_polylepis.1
MKPGRDGSDVSRFLRHFTRTEWGTHSTENSRVGTPTQGSSSCGVRTTLMRDVRTQARRMTP